MGKGGRVLCIITPYALTIASLICLIMVGLGCTNSNSGSLNNLYFFRANLQNVTESSEVQSGVDQALDKLGKANIHVDDGDIKTALEQVQKQLGVTVADFYDIGLWGYCQGNVTKDNKYDTSECSKPKTEFWFNPMEVWNLEQTGLQNALPDGMDKALDVYKKVSKWMSVAYIIAFVATVIELLVGAFAICSRWGSCVTTLISVVAFLFTAAASATSTALFVVILGLFNEKLKPLGIVGSIGKNIYAASWLAVAFSLAAALFWLLSTCCCSGRSPYNHKNRAGPRPVTAEKTPYTYEPLGPYDNNQANTSYPPLPPQSRANNAYEPFRHA
ncbi:SUR7/PalI family protein [Aspergillus candidus]|uniref:SUR7/PalI family-domain-containing protein n=1 Tax=Aspergillus candidus TaxID=41067 RepID=A0A2I2FEN3_ASPCN|nr:SUR7/PalI family-domain-containing protein [Aspergillus candidus]PLB39101.1 SUR7/PalI family-domain-containing protein [Aspergillus candidus]